MWETTQRKLGKGTSSRHHRRSSDCPTCRGLPRTSLHHAHPGGLPHKRLCLLQMLSQRAGSRRRRSSWHSLYVCRNNTKSQVQAMIHHSRGRPGGSGRGQVSLLFPPFPPAMATTVRIRSILQLSWDTRHSDWRGTRSGRSNDGPPGQWGSRCRRWWWERCSSTPSPDRNRPGLRGLGLGCVGHHHHSWLRFGPSHHRRRAG